MIYLQRSNNRQKSKLKKTIIWGVITLVLILIVRFAFPGALSNSVDSAAVPLWNADNKLGGLIHKSIMFFRSRNAIIEENRTLKETLHKQEADITYLDTLKKEYDSLMAMYGRSELQKRIIASVLVTPPETPYDILILDAGSRNEVAPGNVVMAEGNVALGKMSEVHEASGKAILFSSPGEKTKVFIERSTTSLSLIGRGGGSFEADVPQDTDIVVGDTLILSGLSFPMIGKVVEIDADVQSSFKKVLVRSAVNFSNIRFVEILGDTKLEGI